MPNDLSPNAIRNARLKNSQMRDRDFADKFLISEAQLVAAHIGEYATRIAHDPDVIMPAVKELGEVMALTRNESCVHERVGTFEKYHSGNHACMVVGPDIDTRIFPKQWAFGFAVEKAGKNGPARSLQFFDHSGDAVQKIHLRDTSNHEIWDKLVADLTHVDQSGLIEVKKRPALEGAKIKEEKRDLLVKKWTEMRDTHQFNGILSKLGINKLGAYRMVEPPLARKVSPDCVGPFLAAVSAAHHKVILFVGNRGNIQIHWGTLDTIKPMGPWLNVLDPKFNLHLRGDHVAEVYVVHKNTKTGPAMSLEAFDAEGSLVFQCFSQRRTEQALTEWQDILSDIPSA